MGKNPFTSLQGLLRIAELVGDMEEEQFEELQRKFRETREWLDEAPFDPEELGIGARIASENAWSGISEQMESDIRMKILDERQGEDDEIVRTSIYMDGFECDEHEIDIMDLDGVVRIDAPDLPEPEPVDVKHHYDLVRSEYKNGILVVYVEQFDEAKPPTDQGQPDSLDESELSDGKWESDDRSEDEDQGGTAV